MTCCRCGESDYNTKCIRSVKLFLFWLLITKQRKRFGILLNNYIAVQFNWHIFIQFNHSKTSQFQCCLFSITNSFIHHFTAHLGSTTDSSIHKLKRFVVYSVNRTLRLTSGSDFSLLWWCVLCSSERFDTCRWWNK